MSNYVDLPAVGSASWKDPVSTAAALPAIGNSIGDARVAKDTSIIYVWSGSAWVAAGGGGGGITSINADTTAAQTLSVGTSGTDFAIVDAGGGSHVFNLPSASSSNRGVITTGSQTIAGAKTFSSAPTVTPFNTAGVVVNSAAGLLSSSTNIGLGTIGITIDGGGVTPSTGVKGYIYIPYACTINSVTLMADVSGSCVVDIWKVAYASFPPTVANTITASDLPTLSSQQNSQDTTLTGWTTSVSAGDVMAFNLNSASTLTRINLVLKVTKT